MLYYICNRGSFLFGRPEFSCCGIGNYVDLILMVIEGAWRVREAFRRRFSLSDSFVGFFAACQLRCNTGRFLWVLSEPFRDTRTTCRTFLRGAEGWNSVCFTVNKAHVWFLKTNCSHEAMMHFEQST